jgi:hypothetical protein
VGEEEEFKIDPVLMEEAVYATESSLPAHYSARRGSKTSGSSTPTHHRRRSSYLKLPEHLRAKRDEEEAAHAQERERVRHAGHQNNPTQGQSEVLSMVARKREERKKATDIAGYLQGRVSEDQHAYNGFMQDTGGQPKPDQELDRLLEVDVQAQAEPDILY